LASDQEWCLECGSARTLIHHAPDWRVPVAIVAMLLVLVLASFAIAFTELSRNANQSAALPATPTKTDNRPGSGAREPAGALRGGQRKPGHHGVRRARASRAMGAGATLSARDDPATAVGAPMTSSVAATERARASRA
jgi:hypothetical protein